MIEFANIDNFYSRYVISQSDELHIEEKGGGCCLNGNSDNDISNSMACSGVGGNWIDNTQLGCLPVPGEDPIWRCCFIDGSGEVGTFTIPNQEASGEPVVVTIEGNPKLFKKLCEQHSSTEWTTEDCVEQEEEEDDWGETVSENGNVACSVECLNCLREAMAEHESGNDCDAVGDGGNALGLYQIWPWYIADALKACEGYGGSTPCEPCCALRDYLPDPPPPPSPACLAKCDELEDPEQIPDCRNNCIRAAKAQYIWNLLKSTSTLTCEERNELSTLIILSYFIYRSQHQSDHGQGSGEGGSMTCEDLARLHNGGSTFDKKDSLQQGNSQDYWDDRIKPIMQQNCPGCVN